MPKKQNERTADAERASRLRDNKRRHRARRKEYISDLEHRLAEQRERGVQATKEVQLAAQRTMRENARLRELIRRTGVDDNAIDTWLRQDDCQDRSEPSQRSEEQAVEHDQEPAYSTTAKCAAKESSHSISLSAVTQTSPESSSATVGNVMRKPEQSSTTSCTTETSPPAYAGPCISGTLSRPPQPEPAKLPCKLLTHLAENPAADITQVPLPPASDEQGCAPNSNSNRRLDGVECVTAYKMLMQYATSDGKLDEIAQALEEGCTMLEGGGCRVKNNVIWKVLDGACG